MPNLREITTELNLRGRRVDVVKANTEATEPKTYWMEIAIPGDIMLREVFYGSTLDCLKAGLKLAAQLEFSTIPPYLVALWCVIDENHSVARTLRTIVHEEMLHMALANNMLSAIGGVPQLTGSASPLYPGPLPGGVHPELVVELSGLTDKSLEVFLEIERPLVRVPVENVEQPTPPEVDSTISEFYETVLRTLNELTPEFLTTRQIAGPLAPMVISGPEDCEKAVQLILTQGEGGHGVPFDTGAEDLAHYYRFLEVKLGHRLVWNETLRILQKAEPVRAPSVYPVAAPPAQGWGRAAPPRIRWLSTEFNRLYSELLELLEQSWLEGGQRAFLGALERMFGMQELAREMVRTPGPGGAGYAPEFRYMSPENR